MNKVKFVQSDLLKQSGIRHGWFMRSGGVSKDLFESLNGKKGSGDSIENVDVNRKRAARALFPEHADGSDQISHIVHNFNSNILFANSPGEYKDYDASISLAQNIVLSQTTADCASIILASFTGTVVSLVHGSWHTLSAKIICDVVAKIKSLSKNEEIMAGIGPMICVKCYEFGSEATELFDPRYVVTKNGKYFVNLKQMVINQLLESGVTQIDDLNICTKEDDRFFSHRNHGARSGRFLTLAKIK